MLEQCKNMLRHSLKTGGGYSNLWVPESYEFRQYSVEWEASPLGVETILCMPDSICKHTLGSNIASSVCKELMLKRQSVKDEMNICDKLAGLDPRNQAMKDKSRALYHLQWALKIAANSLYGSLAFKQYNTYSPRCGMSVTMIGRWSLHIALAVAQGLGTIVVYDDTNSVMFTVPQLVPGCSARIASAGRIPAVDMTSRSLLPSYVDNLCKEMLMSREEALEFLCGSKSFPEIQGQGYKKS
jgi:hypothetical protein